MTAMKKLYEKDFALRKNWWIEKIDEARSDINSVISELVAAKASGFSDYLQEQYKTNITDMIVKAIKDTKKSMYYTAKKEDFDKQLSHNIKMFFEQFKKFKINGEIHLAFDDDADWANDDDNDIIITNASEVFWFIDAENSSFDIENETADIVFLSDAKYQEARDATAEFLEERVDNFINDFNTSISPNFDKWDIFLENIDHINSEMYAEWLYAYAPSHSTDPMLTQIEVSQTDDSYFVSLTKKVEIPSIPWFMNPYCYEPVFEHLQFLANRIYTCAGKHGDINNYAGVGNGGDKSKIKPVSKNEINVYARPWYVVVDKGIEYDESLIENEDEHMVLFFRDEFEAGAFYSSNFDGIVIPSSVALDFETIHASFMMQITMSGVNLNIDLDQYSPYADYKAHFDVDTERYLKDDDYANSVKKELAEKRKQLVKPVWEGKIDL